MDPKFLRNPEVLKEAQQEERGGVRWKSYDARKEMASVSSVLAQFYCYYDPLRWNYIGVLYGECFLCFRMSELDSIEISVDLAAAR
jgi:hypothetical protein